MGGSAPHTPWDLSLFSSRVDVFSFLVSSNCRKMERLDRRIGQRRDATRAPTQARSGWRPSGRLLVSPLHHLRTGKILSKRWGPPQFSRKRIVQFGQLTYGMYVFHAFVLQTINTWVLVPLHCPTGSSNLGSLMNLGLGLPITFLIAWAVWHLFEGRFYALKSKYAVIQSGFTSRSENPSSPKRAGATATV
jgi:hypothetical protein